MSSLVETTVKRPKLLFFVTEDWVFCSHRLALGQAAVNAGYEVVLVTRLREHKKLIEVRERRKRRLKPDDAKLG